MPAGLDVLTEDIRSVFARTEPLWGELRGGRLFVTGGTGFWGSWLLSSFIYANDRLGLGADAVVLTRDPDSFRRSHPTLAGARGVCLHKGDVADFEFPSGGFTHVIHAASELSMAQQRNPIELIETTLHGVRRVFRLARERGARKLLFTSSGAVYGPMVMGRGPLREDGLLSGVPLNPAGAYAEAKRMAELVCSIEGATHGIDVKIARGFSFIGPFLPLGSHLAAACFLRASVEDEELVVQGHGQTVRSYLYGADLAVWLWTILFKGQGGRPYNLGSDVPVTIAELAYKVARLGGRNRSVQIVGRVRPEELIDVYIPDIGRANSELQLDVYTDIDEAIARSLSYFKGGAPRVSEL